MSHVRHLLSLQIGDCWTIERRKEYAIERIVVWQSEESTRGRGTTGWAAQKLSPTETNQMDCQTTQGAESSHFRSAGRNA